jgi:hypothetical protein
MFVLHKKSGFALVEEGQIKILGESGGKGCMCINEWFKPIFPLFLTPKFDFAPPSPAPHPHLLRYVPSLLTVPPTAGRGVNGAHEPEELLAKLKIKQNA